MAASVCPQHNCMWFGCDNCFANHVLKDCASIRSYVPETFQSQPAVFSSRSCLHSAAVGVCKSSNLVKLAVSNAALLYLSAKEIAEY